MIWWGAAISLLRRQATAPGSGDSSEFQQQLRRHRRRMGPYYIMLLPLITMPICFRIGNYLNSPFNFMFFSDDRHPSHLPNCNASALLSLSSSDPGEINRLRRTFRLTFLYAFRQNHLVGRHWWRHCTRLPYRDSPGHTNVTTKRMSEMDWLWYSFMFERFLFEKDRKANISFSNRRYYEYGACII